MYIHMALIVPRHIKADLAHRLTVFLSDINERIGAVQFFETIVYALPIQFLRRKRTCA